ncbi:MAG: polyprenyl synthetase family protein [Ferrimicrobium sp.]
MIQEPDRQSQVLIAQQMPDSVTQVSEWLDSAIAKFFLSETRRWESINPTFVAPIAALQGFVEAGGKRIRPSFCYWAYVGAGGDPADGSIVNILLGLELLHSFALIHDDVMDRSDLRRGEPSMHRRFTDSHRSSNWRGDAVQFGAAAAVLIGDMAFAYADRLFDGASAETRSVFSDLKLEVNFGQYLDMMGSAAEVGDAAVAEQIATYKSGKYTIERPMHIGVSLAGALGRFEAGISHFALPLGLAFQLRDDLLGVFGDPLRTKKPVGDDLREGKSTLLVSLARQTLTLSGQVDFDHRFGRRDIDEDDVAAMQRLIEGSGARERIELRIAELHDEALSALEALEFSSEARAALVEMAAFVVERTA